MNVFEWESFDSLWVSSSSQSVWFDLVAVRAQMDFRLTCIVSFVKRIVMDFRAINLFILVVRCAWCALEILFQETKYIVDMRTLKIRDKTMEKCRQTLCHLNHNYNISDLLCLFSVNWWLTFFSTWQQQQQQQHNISKIVIYSTL